MKNLKYLIFTIPFYLMIACGTDSNEAVESDAAADNHTCTEKCNEGTHNCGEHCGCGESCECTQGASCSGMCKPEKS